MKNKILTLIGLLCCLNLSSAQSPLQVNDSKLNHVVVFLGGAQLFRQAEVSLKAGINEVEIKGLSPYISSTSLSVSVLEKQKLLSVNCRLDYLNPQTVTKEIERIKASLDTARIAIKRLNNKYELASTKEIILQKNHTVSGYQDGLSTTELSKLIDYQMAQLETTKETQLLLSLELNQIVSDTLKLFQQMNALLNPTQTETSVLVLVIDSPENAKIQIDFSYFAEGASWFPSYDIRAKQLNKPLSLTYRATVKQHTGEDWKDVKLSLSTGEPQRNSKAPSLSVWRLGISNTYVQKTTKTSPYSTCISTADGNEITSNQRGSIIEVRDEIGEIVADATLNIENTTIATTTDRLGKAELYLPLNQNAVVIKQAGFKTMRAVITNERMTLYVSREGKDYTNLWKTQTPMVQLDQTREGRTVTGAEIMRMPTKNVAGITSSVAGASSSDGADAAIKGSRSNATNYYIDGIRVSGNSIPATELLGYQLGSYSNTAEEIMEAFEVLPTESATGFEYNIETPYSFPSNGKSYSVDIETLEIPVTFTHFCAPRIEKEVYLQATVSKWEQYQLLDGMANIYLENTYVGRTLLSLNASDDTLVLSLGRDKNVLVERNLQKTFSKNTVFGNTKTVSRSWEYVLRNTRAEAVQVLMMDQFPIATDRRIQVEKTNYSNGIVHETYGFVTWKFNVQPNGIEKRQLAYEVKHPKSLTFSLD